MHIAEGFLPHPWWEVWFALAIPVIIYGIHRLKILISEKPELKTMIALAGAFIFVLSSLKIPSVTGSCSHPTGTGLAVVLFGPWVTSVLSAIVLLYQALLLAHGGISTFGANVSSMGIIGPFVGWIVYKIMRKSGAGIFKTVFVVSVISDWFTYIVTSFQLGLAFPSTHGGVLASSGVFLSIFAITQIPLAIIEGLAATALFKYLIQLKPDIMDVIKSTKSEVAG